MDPLVLRCIGALVTALVAVALLKVYDTFYHKQYERGDYVKLFIAGFISGFAGIFAFDMLLNNRVSLPQFGGNSGGDQPTIPSTNATSAFQKFKYAQGSPNF